MKKNYSISELKKLLTPIFGSNSSIEKVWLFESRARGDYDEDSDYDFFC